MKPPLLPLKLALEGQNDVFNQSNSIGDTFAEIEGKRDKSNEFVVKYPEEIYKE